MNKRNLSILIAAVTASVLVCCSKQSETDPKIPENGDGQYQSLELTSVRESEFQSKAVVDGETFPQDGHIGLFLFADAAASQTYGEGYKNVDYSYNSQKGKWTASPSIKVGSTPGYLYGYYPYKAGTQQQPVNIKAIQVASSFNGDDVMYATAQDPITDQTAGNVSVTMKHALARVSITVVNKGYTGNAKLSSINFADAEIAESGTLNAVDGSITATKAEVVTLSVPETLQTIATGNGTTYECLLVPSAVKEGRQNVALTLKIDGQEKSANLTGDNGVIFGSGVKSRIVINLSNSGISVAGVSINDWQTVEVGGHKVTVKRSSEDGIADDVFLDVTSNGSTVTIKTLSATGRFTQCTCTPAGKATCTPSIDATTGIRTFTITDVQDDITAEVGYLKCNVTVEYDSDMGSVKLNGVAVASGSPVPFFGGEEVKFLAEAKSGCGFVKWTDGNDNDLSTDNPYEFTVSQSASYVAVFRLNDALSGVFTVAADGQGKPTKKVLFSKGNLYCSGVEFYTDEAADKYGTVKSMANAQWGFEANQYDTTPSSDGDRDGNHISHFMWCANATNAMALKYDDGWKTDTTFFAGKNFTVNGYSGWRTLSNGEWTYLLETRKEDNKFAKAKINGMIGLLIFPDGYSLPSGYSPNGGTGMSKVNDKSAGFPSENIPDDGDNKIWPEMEADGVVFLPAAGFRSGFGNARVNNVDFIGYYCSASPDGVNLAYALSFQSGEVVAQDFYARSNAQSVRLVAESK